MKDLDKFSFRYALWLRMSVFAILITVANGDQPIKICVAEPKSAKIIDASVIEIPRSVAARISFYEVTKPFLELDKNMTSVLRSKIIEGKFDEKAPLMGRPSAWFIVDGLSVDGSVILALGEGEIIFYRGCSLITTTAYQNDDRVFGEGNTRDSKLWKALSDLAVSIQSSRK